MKHQMDILSLKLTRITKPADAAESPFRELLRTDGCRQAAETQKEFTAHGTVIEHILGVAHLIRLVGGGEEGTSWGTVTRRDGRERDEPTELTPTATVLLPAIPTWLPLWSLLSPHDARRGGNSEDERHEDGSSIPMGSTSAASGVDARPRGILSTTTDGKDCFGKQLPILKHCESDNQGSGNDEGEFMRAAEVGDADGQAGPVPWGRGAVGRIQVVAAGQAAYRFSAVLHFFDVADAAVFVRKFNGLSLPQHGVLKALFLVDSRTIRDSPAIQTAEEDGEAWSRRWRKRRSLSEGVALGSTAAYVQQSGSEEFKSNWPDDSTSNQGILSHSPPAERLLSRETDDGGTVRKGTDRWRTHVENIPPGSDCSDSAASRTTPVASPKWPESAKEAEDSGGSDARKVRQRDGGRGGAQERKGREASGSYPPPPPPLIPWNPSGKDLDVRSVARSSSSSRRFRGPGAEGEAGGGGGRYFWDRGAGTELPPCPVCFDRLDPTVSGVPPPTARVEGRAVQGLVGGSPNCNHRECDSVRQDPVGARKAPAASGPSTGASETTDPAPRERNTWALAVGVSKGGLTGKRGPRWGGERQEDEAEVFDGAGKRRALNVTTWRGSDCRVCQSLNAAMKGTADVLCCQTCRIPHNLWICMVCGHIGCGRYTEEHANRHFRLSRHSYSLELSTGRVWNYTEDCYAHRALRGHPASSDHGGHFGRRDHHRRWDLGEASRGESRTGDGRGDGGEARGSPASLYPKGEFDEHGQAETSKVAVVSREYEALVARQLEEQQRYFEGLIATAVAAEAEANAPGDEGMTDEEGAEVARLREEVDAFTSKYGDLQDSLRAGEEAARRVRSENRALVSEQRKQKSEEVRVKAETRETEVRCKKQMAELEGQMQDLLFFIKAQQEEEIVGGSVVVGDTQGSTGSGKAEGKETEKDRLSRRLKEFSNARKAGGGGGSNSHR